MPHLKFTRPAVTLLMVGLMMLTSILTSTSITRAAGVPTGGNGLRISPVRSDVTINPGTTATVTINITNVTSAPADLQAIINDFTANPDESGNPDIILDPTQYASSHSLKRFILPISNVHLDPGQEKAITVTIVVPKDAAGGGYFGAIRFAPASVAAGNSQVSLAGSVGSLILAKVPGAIKEQMSIASFDTRVNDQPSSFFTSNKSINAVVRFQNEGNIQEEPFGKILLKNRSGKILATYEVNNTSPAGNVLPNSIRKFSIPLSKVGKFGQFKLEGNFGYGSNGTLLSASTTFYVIPLYLILIFIAIVIFLVFLIFGLPRLIKAYNRRILRRARR